MEPLLSNTNLGFENCFPDDPEGAYTEDLAEVEEIRYVLLQSHLSPAGYFEGGVALRIASQVRFDVAVVRGRAYQL